MRTTLAVLLAAALAASATPAAACGFFRCLGEAMADDSYPPGETAAAARRADGGDRPPRIRA